MIENIPLNYRFPNPKHWIYEPQEDITAYELSLILPLIMFASNHLQYGALELETTPNWDKIKRHFKESE